jgi:hypothetical protein
MSIRMLPRRSLGAYFPLGWMPSKSFWISTFSTTFQENWDRLEIRILIFGVHAELPIFLWDVH